MSSKGYKGNYEEFIGEPIYVINKAKPIINIYKVHRIQHGEASYQKTTIQYNILQNTMNFITPPIRLNVYTLGNKSWTIDSRFQLDPIKAVLSFFKLHSDKKIIDDYTKDFIAKVINKFPEYFI